MSIVINEEINKIWDEHNKYEKVIVGLKKELKIEINLSNAAFDSSDKKTHVFVDKNVLEKLKTLEEKILLAEDAAKRLLDKHQQLIEQNRDEGMKNFFKIAVETVDNLCKKWKKREGIDKNDTT